RASRGRPDRSWDWWSQSQDRANLTLSGLRADPHRAGRAPAGGPSSLSGAFQVEFGISGRVLGGPAALTGDDVGGVPPRPVVLGGSRFVRAVALLGFAQQSGQRRDVQAEPTPGKPGLDLLQQPAVAVGVAERGPRAVG